MRVAAFDLSLTRPAACVDGRLDVLETKKLRGHERIHAILEWVRGQTCHVSAASVDLVAIEGYSYSSQASRAHAAGELGGIVRHDLWTFYVPYLEVPPASVKTYATGKGNAGKDDVLTAAIRRGGELFTGSSNDEADAFFVWALTMDLAGSPVLTMPASHRRALDKLHLPEGVAHASNA